METEHTGIGSVLRNRFDINFAYLALLLLSLPFPWLHHIWTDRTIESMRPVLMHADGTYDAMLLPTLLLGVRYLGELSFWPPLILLALFLLSFKFEQLTRFTILCGLAVCLCAFNTFYGTYATLAFGIEQTLHNR